MNIGAMDLGALPWVPTQGLWRVFFILYLHVIVYLSVDLSICLLSLPLSRPTCVYLHKRNINMDVYRYGYICVRFGMHIALNKQMYEYDIMFIYLSIIIHLGWICIKMWFGTWPCDSGSHFVINARFTTTSVWISQTESKALGMLPRLSSCCGRPQPSAAETPNTMPHKTVAVPFPATTSEQQLVSALSASSASSAEMASGNGTPGTRNTQSLQIRKPNVIKCP